jgi:uncharacterized protein YfdQ (DUF2303 family)
MPTEETTEEIELEVGVLASGVEAERPVRIATPGDELVALNGRPAAVADLLPPGWTRHEIDTTDIEKAFPIPSRLRGTTVVESAQDLVTAVGQRATGPVALYALERDLSIVAVLNDSHGDDAGHGDYKVVAQLQRSPEWQAWLDGQGLHSQVQFAEFIEDHLTDITTPPAASMLELAQTFHAHTAARFSTTQRLQSGRVALTYEEDQEVTAGGDRRIEIPAEFEIAVRPFYGTDRVKVTARLRYRVGRGDLSLGWQLNRPDEIERVIFGEQIDAAAAALEVTAIRGVPPRPRWA